MNFIFKSQFLLILALYLLKQAGDNLLANKCSFLVKVSLFSILIIFQQVELFYSWLLDSITHCVALLPVVSTFYEIGAKENDVKFLQD